MNRRGKIIISITGIILISLFLIALTYGYYITKIKGNSNSRSITATTADLSLVYGDGNGIIEPTDTILPGDTIASKTFTVTNDGKGTVNDYVVVFENVYNELSRPEDMVYTVECTSSDDKTCDGVSTEKQFPSGKGSVDAGEGFGIIVTNSIDKDVVHTYTLTLKYLNANVDQSDDMNKTIQGKINIKDGNEINPYKSQEGTLANAIINNAVNLTSEQKSLGYAEFRTTPLTTPAVEISSENESEITMANDDYGVSYYYRGNVKNNYLTFNNMCFRVVRIEGDGSIKIVLADASAGCSENTTDTYSAFIGAGNYGYTKEYVINSSGETSSSEKTMADYLNGQTNSAKSMNTMLDAWLTKKQIDTSKLKQDTWCLGNWTDLYNSKGVLLTSSKNDLMYNNTEFHYRTNIRLNGIGETANTTYKCNGINDESFYSYIGGLTADEVTYAGGKKGVYHNSYYLKTIALWRTITLALSYAKGLESAYGVDDSGRLNNNYDVASVYYIRPALTLKSGTKISNGDGTQENPYIVN